MKNRNYLELEGMCQLRFNDVGSCFHVCSQENHPVLFHNEEEFKVAMNVVAYVALMFPSVKVLTFAIMDNHFHFTLAGEMEYVQSFVKVLVSKLASHSGLSSNGDFKTVKFKVIRIESLENLRNVIAYNNRNGAVVSPDENVFTYQWGANRYFFNREAKLRYEECGHKATCREKRKAFCSGQLDGNDGVIMLDGYVSPLCYCHVGEAESFFRNNRQYFYCVSPNMESVKDIAKSIGESIFYSDEDLFSHVGTLCVKKYGCQSVVSLTPESKIEIAKELHFSFNASNKQICRLLKMDITVVSALFPSSC